MEENEYQDREYTTYDNIIEDPLFLEKIKTFTYDPNKEYVKKEWDGEITMHDKLSGDETTDYKGITVKNPGGYRHINDVIKKFYEEYERNNKRWI